MKYIYNFLQNVKLTDFWNSFHLDYLSKIEKLRAILQILNLGEGGLQHSFYMLIYRFVIIYTGENKYTITCTCLFSLIIYVDAHTHTYDIYMTTVGKIN